MSIYNFPNQRIPEAKKDEEWYKLHIINYVNYSNTKVYSQKKQELLELYNAYQAIISPEKEKIICATLTERYGENLGPKYEVYPLCETIVDQLVSKYRLRPLKRRCFANNPDAVVKKFDKNIELLTEQIIREANKEVSPIIGVEVESPNPDIQVPEDVQTFMTKNYRTMAEEASEVILYQGLVVNKEKEKLYDALIHFLVTGTVWGLPVEKNGTPSLYIPHLLNTYFDLNPHQSIQDDPMYFVYDEFLSVNEIFNTYDLTEDQKKAIENYGNYDQKGKKTSYVTNSSWFKTEGADHRVRVIHMNWISKKIIRALKVENKKTGKEEYKLLKDKDKVRNRDIEKLETRELDVERYIIMVGPDVVVDFGESEVQLSKVASPNKKYLKPVGVVDKMSLQTGETRSLVKKIAFLQDFASEILYELRIALRQVDGNVLGYDLSDIPKEWASLGLAVINKVNFHLKRDRIKFYNSKQTKGNTYASSQNVSQGGRLRELVDLLIIIEDLARKIAGIPKEEYGEAHHNQKATVAQMNMTAGTISSERYYGVFDTFVEKLLERYIMISKNIYKKGQVFSYFAGDNLMKFLRFEEDFFNEDIGISISDNGKEYERSQKIDTIAEQAFSNATNVPEIMKDLLKLLNAEDSTEKIAIFERGIQRLEEIRKENNEMARRELEEKSNIEKMKEEKLDIRHQEQLDNNIEVAKIYANSKRDEILEKEAGQDRRKAADIEKELALNTKEK